MFVRLLGIFAQFERERITERINDTFEEMVAQGRAITGTQPFGYKVENGMVVIDEDKKDIVIDMFDTYEKMQSQRAAFTKLKEKYDLKMTLNGYIKILKNPIYIGQYKNNKEYTTPIISKKQFDNVQKIKKNKNVKVYEHTRTHLFSGLIIDIHCGGKMSANAYHIHTPYEGTQYRCAKYRNNKTCDSKSVVNENLLEKYLLDNLATEINEYFSKIKIEYKEHSKNKVNYEKRIESLKEELERLNIIYLRKS